MSRSWLGTNSIHELINLSVNLTNVFPSHIHVQHNNKLKIWNSNNITHAVIDDILHVLTFISTNFYPNQRPSACAIQKWNSSSCYYYLHCSVINDFLCVLDFLIAPPPLFLISIFAQRIVDPIRIIKLISKIMRLWTKSLGNHHLQVNFRQIKQNSHVCSYILEAVCWMAPYLWNKHYMHFAKYGDKHRIPAQNVNIITDSQLIGMRLYFLPFI